MKKKDKIILLLIIICTLLSAPTKANQGRITYYVSPLGNDNNVGSFINPFASLSKAQAEVSKRLKQGSQDSIIIYLRKGSYYLSESLRFREQDGGSLECPVIYKAYQNEEVCITGGKKIPVQAASKIKKKNILSRLSPEVRDRLLQVDLERIGLKNYGQLRPRGFRRPYYPSAMEIFYNKKPMRIARWPNDKMIPMGEVIEQGSVPRNSDYSGKGGKFKFNSDRPLRWEKARDIWLFGYFHYGFADDVVKVKDLDVKNKTISTVHETMYGFASDDIHQKWYAFNLLEEIDKPGEYYIDREKGILYFYPLDEELISLEVSITESPLVSIIDASNIIFQGIIFECSRGMGVYVEGGQNNRIENCTFRNLGLLAVCIGKGIEPFDTLVHNGTGKLASEILGSWHEHIYDNPTFKRRAGSGHRIISCEMYNLGSGGISLSGGDRLTLEKGLNTVENCRIYNFNRLDKTYRAGINIDGVGNEIRHCEIYNCPGSAIYLHGNDHIIEYNEIHNAVMDGDDMGAIYYGRDPSELGNKVRFNYFHHLGSGDLRAGHRKIIAIYHDDGACGMEVTGNVFYKAGSRNVSLGGGNDNIYRNNIFIDAKLSIHHDNRLQGWARYMCDPGGIFEDRLERVNYQSPPYANAYPDLVNYFKDRPGLPKRNIIEYNLFLEVDMVYNGSPKFSGFGENLIVCSDPGFVDFKNQNFDLRKDSKVFTIMPEFKLIPFHKIGLLKNE